MTNIISFTNHKGGVAKTTTTANVGSILAGMGYKVLLVDLDAQSNLTTYFLPNIPERTIFNALESEEGELPIFNIRERMDIVPSSLQMATIEYVVMSKIDRNELLKYRLQEVSERYDFILLDCPPSLGIITTNALVASTGVIIPTTAEVIPVKGLKTITQMIQTIQKRANPSLSLQGIIITRFRGTKVNKDIAEGIRESFPNIVFNTNVRENVTVSEAPQVRTDIVSYSPGSNGAIDYTQIAKELISRTI